MQSHPNILNLLSPIDYAVYLIIIIITLGFIIYGHTLKKKNLNKDQNYVELMLMGRQLTLPIFVMTLVATWYGGIFGVSEMAFKYGIFNFVSQGVFWYITYIIFAFFIIKKIKSYEAMTLPDLIGNMFGNKSRFLAAIMNIFNLVPIVYVISLGLLIQLIFNLDFTWAMVVGISFVSLYSLFGGFRAVVFSDIFQFFIMVISVALVFVISVNQFGFTAFEKLPDSYFYPLGTFSLTETFAWGLIALSTLVDPNFYQRCFAAKNFEVAKKGILISTVIWLFFDLSLTFGAIYAKSQIPDAPSEYGYFYYALQLLPSGLKGFFLAGITATILSTLDSYLFLAGSTISHDLLPKKYRHSIISHKLSIVSIAVLSFIMATGFEGDIKAVWKTLGSLSSSALLIPVIFGHLFPNKISDHGFFYSSLAGATGAFIWRLGGYKYTYNLDEIYIGMLAAFIVITSFTLKGTTAKN